MDSTPSLVERAVIALSASRHSEAESALRAIDFPALVQERRAAMNRVWGPAGVAAGYKSLSARTKRLRPKCADVRATFVRDGYVCRYSHCRRRTISLDVLKLLSEAVPGVLPYHPNWKPVESHILYWTYSTSLEHRVPFPSGGTSAAENLLTACYQCNDVKRHLPAELLGWSVDPPPGRWEWDGLTRHLPMLQQVVAARTER